MGRCGSVKMLRRSSSKGNRLSADKIGQYDDAAVFGDVHGCDHGFDIEIVGHFAGEGDGRVTHCAVAVFQGRATNGDLVGIGLFGVTGAGVEHQVFQAHTGQFIDQEASIFSIGVGLYSQGQVVFFGQFSHGICIVGGGCINQGAFEAGAFDTRLSSL